MDTTRLLEYLAPDIENINLAMKAELEYIRDSELKHIINHALFNGGKRIRPILTLLAARLLDHPDAGQKIVNPGKNSLLKLALIFEFLHAASLLHDDVIDHADQRRGKASANTIWGNSKVILAGDYLHTRAMTLAGTAGGIRSLEIIGNSTSIMIDAEFLQMHNVTEICLSEENYYAVLQGKTAALIAAACEVGAVYAGADASQCMALRLYGEQLGLAFQIVDDLLDYLGDSQKTGKTIGNDFKEGKMTLPLIHAMSQAESSDYDHLVQLLEKSPQQREKELSHATELIRRYKGFDYARARAAEHVENALGSLAEFSPCPARDIFTGLTTYVLTRKK